MGPVRNGKILLCGVIGFVATVLLSIEAQTEVTRLVTSSLTIVLATLASWAWIWTRPADATLEAKVKAARAFFIAHPVSNILEVAMTAEKLSKELAELKASTMKELTDRQQEYATALQKYQDVQRQDLLDLTQLRTELSAAKTEVWDLKDITDHLNAKGVESGKEVAALKAQVASLTPVAENQASRFERLLAAGQAEVARAINALASIVQPGSAPTSPVLTQPAAVAGPSPAATPVGKKAVQQAAAATPHTCYLHASIPHCGKCREKGGKTLPVCDACAISLSQKGIDIIDLPATWPVSPSAALVATGTP
jgi:hypothetical protein